VRAGSPTEKTQAPMICRFLVGLKKRLDAQAALRLPPGSRAGRVQTPLSHQRVRAILLSPLCFDNGVKPFLVDRLCPRPECANSCTRASQAKLKLFPSRSIEPKSEVRAKSQEKWGPCRHRPAKSFTALVTTMQKVHPVTTMPKVHPAKLGS
jgi:hypothetical protein